MDGCSRLARTALKYKEYGGTLYVFWGQSFFNIKGGGDGGTDTWDRQVLQKHA